MLKVSCRFTPIYLASLLVITACGRVEELRRAYSQTNPREAYETGLRSSGLSNTALGIAWRYASEKALNEPLAPDHPHLEHGFANLVSPEVTGYELFLKRG